MLIVLDGFGAGETEDAHEFGDEGSYTSSHVLTSRPNIHAPFLLSHGLLAHQHTDIIAPENPNKDTLTGLYELMGLVYPKLPTFHEGFSTNHIQEIETLISRSIIGNYPSSGTEIIKVLGEEHLHTGNVIVYTSSDSVFQLAAHQEVVSVSLLYYYCTLIRKYFDGLVPVGRIIARPFLGNNSNCFYRTPHRKDFPYIPPQKHLLDKLLSNHINVIGNHVIDHLFPSKLSKVLPGKTDLECLNSLMQDMQSNHDSSCFYFIDLEELDMKYGHRRDPEGYANALEKLDPLLCKVSSMLEDDDLLIITADHGNDPVFTRHTNHTREYVPYLVISGSGKRESHGHIRGMSWIAQRIELFFNHLQ